MLQRQTEEVLKVQEFSRNNWIVKGLKMKKTIIQNRAAKIQE